MGVVRIQSKAAGGNGTSLVITLDAAPLPASQMIAAVATEGPNVTSLVQTDAVWVQTARASGPPTEAYLFAGFMGNAAGTQITINLASSSVAAVVREYIGLTSFVDLAAKTAVGTGSPARSGSPGTTTVARELWVAALSARHASAVFSNPRDGFQIVDQISGTGAAADGQRVVLLDKIVDQIGNPEAIADISGPTLEWAAALRLFKSAAQTPQDPAGPPTPPPTVPEALAKQDDHVADGLANLVQQFRSVT